MGSSLSPNQVDIDSQETSSLIDYDTVECETEFSSNVKYLTYQQTIQKAVLNIKELTTKMPMVKSLTGEYAYANRKDYMDLLGYFIHKHSMSEGDRTELISLLKKISKRNGKEIPLPSRYSINSLTHFHGHV